MFAELEALLWRLMWRLTLSLVVLLLRLYWLPLLIVAIAYYVVLPAVVSLAQLIANVLQPAAALAAAIFLLWLWRR